MAVAAVATLPTIDRQPLSWDESVTRSAADRSPHQLFGLLAHTDAPLGLYYLLMHGWTGLGRALDVGSSAGWLRLPSALAAIAAVGVLVLLVDRWFGSRAALLSGLLLAVHPMLTFYGQDARPYTLVTLCFLLATWALLPALERPTAARARPVRRPGDADPLPAPVRRVCLRRPRPAGRARRRPPPPVGRRGGGRARGGPAAAPGRSAPGRGGRLGPAPVGRQVWSVLVRMFGGSWLVAALLAVVILARPSRCRLPRGIPGHLAGRARPRAWSWSTSWCRTWWPATAWSACRPPSRSSPSWRCAGTGHGTGPAWSGCSRRWRSWSRPGPRRATVAPVQVRGLPRRRRRHGGPGPTGRRGDVLPHVHARRLRVLRHPRARPAQCA